MVSLAKVFVLFCLPDLSPASHNGVALLLEGSLKPRHLPLPTGREVAGIGLWEWWRELKGSLFCSSEQLLLLLKENSAFMSRTATAKFSATLGGHYWSRRTVSIAAPLTISSP
jgi:hypothetical protein